MQETDTLKQSNLKNQQAYKGMKKHVKLANLIKEHSEESIGYKEELMNVKDISKSLRQHHSDK